MDGTWIGVASPNLPLGRDSSLNTINADEARVWWWRAGGHVWQNHGGSETDRRERRRASNFRRGQEIRMILDCEAETLQFFASPTSEEPVATLVGVTGPVVPFAYFDYDSTAVLISTRSQIAVQPQAAVVNSAICSELCTRTMHLANHQIRQSDGTSPTEKTAILLVQAALACTRRTTQFIQDTVQSERFAEFRAAVQPAASTAEADLLTVLPSAAILGWPFEVLKSCCLRELLSTALVLVGTLSPRRTVTGESVRNQPAHSSHPYVRSNAISITIDCEIAGGSGALAGDRTDDFEFTRDV